MARVTAAASRIWALYAALGILLLGNGLQGTLIGVRTQIEQFGAAVTGVVMASYFAGFLVGSFVVPVFLHRVGHIRVFAALASTASVAALVYTLGVHPLSWSLMRFTTGVCFAGVYVVAESWINSQATNETRGRLLAIYVLVVLGSAAAGQFLLNAADPGGFELFILTSVLISLSVVPVTLSRSPAPEFVIEPGTSVMELARRSPLGVSAGFLSGSASGAIFGMGAVYGTLAGFSTAAITLFMAFSVVGGAAFQLPLGLLSDRIPRRRILFGVAVTGVAIAMVAVWASPSPGIMTVLAFGYGGTAFPMYSLSLAHMNDTTPPDQFVGAAAAFMFVNGVGAVAGPLIVSLSFEIAGPDGYWWSLAAFFTPVAVLGLYRAFDRAKTIRRYRYVPVALRGTPVLGFLLREMIEELEPDAAAESAGEEAAAGDAAGTVTPPDDSRADR